jgi:hypothetical protein
MEVRMGNKRLESSHFKVFRTRVADFPEGEVWHEDAPDFRILAANGVLGVEHCHVHIPTHPSRTPLRAIESQTDDILASAQEHAELRGMRPIQATFLFSKYSTLKKAQRTDLARSIASTVHEVVSEMDDSQPFSSTVIRKSENPRLPAPLVSVHITLLPPESRHFWRCVRAGFAVEDCVDLIQHAIDEKAELYCSHLAQCQECWLLMVAELRPSSFIHPNQQTLDHVFQGPFGRAYFMDMAEQVVHRLKIKGG